MIDSSANAQISLLLLIHKQPNCIRSTPRNIKLLFLPRQEETRPRLTLKLSPNNPCQAAWEIADWAKFGTNRLLRKYHPAAAGSADHCANQGPE